MSLKISASRKDDIDPLDNVGRYTKGQPGLFHVKMAAARMVANEHWGVANSSEPWSLWRMNALLGRKAISAGWKAKSLPPFRPIYELALDLVLPANILDGFRLYCGEDSLEVWADAVKDRDEIRRVAKLIVSELCSGRRVSKLRRRKGVKRDVTLENVILFNRDALFLRNFKRSIKSGDIGSVINVLQVWKVMFRGTGKMPKYADALFHVLTDLEQLPVPLR